MNVGGEEMKRVKIVITIDGNGRFFAQNGNFKDKLDGFSEQEQIDYNTEVLNGFIDDSDWVNPIRHSFVVDVEVPVPVYQNNALLAAKYRVRPPKGAWNRYRILCRELLMDGVPRKQREIISHVKMPQGSFTDVMNHSWFVQTGDAYSLAGGVEATE